MALESAFIFESTELLLIPIPSYVLQSINDSTIAWYGLWSFETVPQLGQVHRSTNVGDKVTAYFKGGSLSVLFHSLHLKSLELH
jgi:hypothetical protein